MPTKAEMEEYVEDYDAVFASMMEAREQRDRIAQEKADLQSELNKATKQLDIFVRRFNGVDHEMSRIREELARLES